MAWQIGMALIVFSRSLAVSVSGPTTRSIHFWREASAGHDDSDSRNPTVAPQVEHLTARGAARARLTPD